MTLNRSTEKSTRIFNDLYSGKIPEAFPIWDAFAPEYMLDYSGYNALQIQYQYSQEIFEQLLEKVMEVSRGDTFEVGYLRNAVSLMLQRSKHFVMSKTGFIQHPESCFMAADEYDEFIKNPYDFVIENIVPRVIPAYDADPITRSLNYAKVVLAGLDQSKALGAAQKKVFDKYGLYTNPPGVTGGLTVPFDKIADSYRSFSQIHLDLRRCPDKVEAACEALMPYAIWGVSRIKPSTVGYAAVKTHMGAYLKTKDFAKYYWPTFFKGCNISAERGVDMDLFLEHDWTRYLDLLSELPQGTRMYMEYGDAQLFKDTLGKKMVLGGFYPLMLLRSGTKQQCIDKAKEVIDIMAPGGNFYFRFDKSAYVIDDLNLDNYYALMDFLRENNTYVNAGECSMPGDKQASIRTGFAKEYPEFKSKYIQTFEEFKGQYPYVYEEAEPYMKAMFEKYTATVQAFNLL